MRKQIEKLRAIHEAIQRREDRIEMYNAFWQQFDAIGRRKNMQDIERKIQKQKKALKTLREKAGQLCYELIKGL